MFKSKKKSEIPPPVEQPPLDRRSDSAMRNDLLGRSAPPSYRSASPSAASNAPTYRQPERGPSSQSYRSSNGHQQQPPVRTNSNGSGRYESAGYQPRGGYANYNSMHGNYDANRAELFRGAKQPSQPQAYGEYRQNGDEEQQQALDEDDEVEAIKQQMRFTKQESLASTRNALRTAREAEETARNTLMRLGDQSERIANTERSVDMAKSHNDRAEDEAKEIKKLNRSIFRPSITFNKTAKRDAAEQRIVDRHNDERDQREEIRRQVFESRDRVGGAFRDLDRQEERAATKRSQPRTDSSRLQDRGRYTFEADEEDEEVEQELDQNLGEIGDLSKRLNLLARAAGDEVRAQNQKLGKLSDKVDALDSSIYRNTERLQRIK